MNAIARSTDRVNRPISSVPGADWADTDCVWASSKRVATKEAPACASSECT
jgi:hypothetical protein